MNITFKNLFTLTILLAILANPFGQVTSLVSANNSHDTPQTDYQVYLPLILNGQGTPPTTLDLIEEAVERGQLSLEQGLIYKVFSVWGDSRLPAQYSGAPNDENAGDGVMREVAQNSVNLSDSAKVTLTPFFLPPTDPESWWAMQHSAAQNQLTANSWQSVTAGGGKIKVWYFTGEADSFRQAGVVKAALDGKIWTAEKTLMNRELKYGTGVLSVLNIYLWHSYAEADGTVVPFNGTRGVALALDCSDTASWIYINNLRPDGDETHPGMIQTVAHELFHAFQNSYLIASCPAYNWLSEATAKWVEDHIYPKANSEWPYATGYLDRANVRLDDTNDAHDYGAYLLPFYLTHQFKDDLIIRRMWQNSESYSNSYQAVKYSLPETYQQYGFWGAFLMELWNKSPFPTSFQDFDKFTGAVKPEWPSAVAVTAPGHEFIKEMTGDLPTGAARYYHFNFPDSTVRSLAFINGLSYNLRKDSTWNSQYGSEFTLKEDQTYASEELTEEQNVGIVQFALLKVAGKTTWDFMPIAADTSFYCADTQGKIEEMIVVLSNGDFDHPDRVLKPLGIPTTLYANNMPCSQYSGTSKVTSYNAGVTTTYSASNVVYKSGSTDLYSFPTFPFIYFDLQGANVNWSMNGTSGKCTYSGSGSFSVGPHPGAGSDSIVLYTGVLAGSPSYRGYQGGGTPDEGQTYIYQRTCDGVTEDVTEHDTYWFLWIPIDEDRANVKISSGGILQGSYKDEDASGGDNWTLYEWNLSPSP